MKNFICKEDVIDIINRQVNILPAKQKFGPRWNVVIRDHDGKQFFINRQKVGTGKSDYIYVLGSQLEKQLKYQPVGQYKEETEATK